ncbi:TPA: hypothetical protein N0F65_005160 [Lagenidium giganteum]|uniref:Methyltransferase type 11 domain-containing protein n=1 Tax=Lagenidium giganteum TaxID=4803 RepID=A0AAV2YSL4_9STRA|nr:TPA: hypothetical protein N0F65_005160 [Lagenidium giganteum]
MRATQNVQRAAATSVRSTTASGSVVYESERAVHEYLQFHFGDPKKVVPYAFAPQDAVAFLPRTVEESARLTPTGQRRRALDVGCAVGRATFELARHFDEAVGVDFSHHFAETANKMKSEGKLPYDALIQGDIWEVRQAAVPSDIDRTKVHFEQGDACNLKPSLGKFDVVFASNLLCRLPNPEKFLTDVSSFINPNGIFALISPYSWLEEYTAKDKWIGGVLDSNGKRIESFDQIERILSSNFKLVKRQDYPFIIREHARKYQWGVSDGTFWQRK